MEKARRVKLLLLYLIVFTLPLTQPLNYVLRRKQYRYFALDFWLEIAIRKGNYEKASRLASEWLSLAQRFGGWNCGNAIHDSCQALGIVALKQGDVEKAKTYLLSAGRTPGSPQLNSFGPCMLLARELLEVGEKDVVLKYLELVGRFWAKKGKKDSPATKTLIRQHKVQLEQWKSEVEAGKVPFHRMWI